MIDIEERLRATFESVAAQTRTPERTWDTAEPKVYHPMMRGAVAFLATMMVFMVALVAFNGRDETPADPVVAAPELQVPTTSTESPAGRTAVGVALDTEGLGVEVVSAGAWADLTPVVGSGQRRLQAFRRSTFDFDGPSFWIDTDYDGTDFFRGGFVQTQGTPTRFGDRDGYLLEVPTLFAFEDGEWDVLVFAHGASPETFDSFIAGLVRVDGGWEATWLPEGISMVSSGSGDPSYPDGSSTAEYELTVDGVTAQVAVSIGNGDEQVLERHVFDFLIRAGLAPSVTVVDGQPVISGSSDTSADATWLDSAGRVVSVHASAPLAILDVVAHVRLPTASEWQELVTIRDADPIRTQLGAGQIGDSDGIGGSSAADVTELAWAEVPGLGRRSLYRWTETIGGEQVTCFGSGGSVCFPGVSFVPAPEVFPWGIGSGTSCVSPIGTTVAAWGLPADVRSLIVGTGSNTIVIRTRGGYAMGGWDRPVRPNPIAVEYDDGTVEWFEPFATIEPSCPLPDDGSG